MAWESFNGSKNWNNNWWGTLNDVSRSQMDGIGVGVRMQNNGTTFRRRAYRSLNAIVLTLGGNLDAAALKLARNHSATLIGSLNIIITFTLAKSSLSRLLCFL
ncbi:hypothetical protein JHK84_039265 [Glycine max]|nr:hypothetical protein JHK87_038828 [Glycine soja]KAG4962168.1 hypothetical protein JHK86_039036 [Glycine max]KAG4964648.1 hypothetical protein JHK85_039623 [Glycine max]KAG5120925.1 hypothetical protein JHK84_039265 [Glycine max]